MLNNTKPYFFLSKMNKKYSTEFGVCRFTVFLALLRNHCYSFRSMKGHKISRILPDFICKNNRFSDCFKF